jgi:hypothetical protein
MLLHRHPELQLSADVLPALSSEQREALECAARGQHLPLLERTYSTGQTVTRTAP